MTRSYTVFYTKTRQGEVDIEATSPTEAQEMFERGRYSQGSEREYDEPVEVYSVEMTE